MKTFGFYSKNDSDKEIIGKVKTINIEDAYNFFAKNKALKLAWFQDLYKVIELKN